jgi:hypothetical protein
MLMRASCTSEVQRVSSSNRPISPFIIAVMIGEGIIESLRLAAWRSPGHVPRVLDVVLGGARGALDDVRRVAGDRRGEQLGEPALAGAGVADEQQAAVGRQRDDRLLDQRGVAEPLLRDRAVEPVGRRGCRG